MESYRECGRLIYINFYVPIHLLLFYSTRMKCCECASIFARCIIFFARAHSIGSVDRFNTRSALTAHTHTHTNHVVMSSQWLIALPILSLSPIPFPSLRLPFLHGF